MLTKGLSNKNIVRTKINYAWRKNNKYNMRTTCENIGLLFLFMQLQKYIVIIISDNYITL